METAQINLVLELQQLAFEVLTLQADLIPKQAQFSVKAQYFIILKHNFLVAFFPQRTREVLSHLLHTVMQVLYLIIEERLEQFHFTFDVAHLSLAYRLEDSATRILDGLNGVLLHLKHFLPDNHLEVAERFPMHHFALHLEVQGLRTQAVQELFVNAGANIDEVEFVRFVLVAHALGANTLLVVKTEEF